MRVSGGEFRSRKLKSLAGNSLRPTPDLLRQVLFNVLGDRIQGAYFVDAYAGTGAVAIEALSRGARHAVLIEKHRAAVQVIHENLSALGLEGRATVVASSAIGVLAKYRGGIVFLDPPYDQLREYTECLRILGEQPPDLVIAQHDKRVSLEGPYGSLGRVRTIVHGDNALSWFQGS